MKVMLVFPPQWTPAMPHLALPTLTSFLRARGVEVIQRDLNLETYDAILTRDYLEQCMERLGTRRTGRHATKHGLPDRARWARAEGPRLAAQVEAAKTVFRSPAYYDGAQSLAAFVVIAQALELASLPSFPAQLDLLNYEPAVAVDSSRELLQAARDPQRNMLLDIFRSGIITDIVREQPDVVGISIPTRGQMLGAVTLAHLIKEAGLPCHVTAGGPHITMLREQLPRVSAFFDLFDSAVPFDGEIPLLRLAETLDAGGDLARVPSLIYRADGQVHVNRRPLKPQSGARSTEAGSAPGAFPLPDFDGLPIGQYLSPEPVLPLLTARGCYHGRCAFCNVGYGEPGHFRPQPPDAVVAQMLELRRKYGAHHIFFADEAMPPHSLRQVSALLEAQGSPLDWCGCVRFEKAFTQELLEGLARGGCRMLLYGLETASGRMIEHMAKGTQREEMSRVLAQSARAGIWNHAFFFFGFPTETMEDAQETVNFVYAHQASLHSASPGAFVLERFSPAWADPARFGIQRIIDDPNRDLAIYFDYQPAAGLDEGMAHTLVERLTETLPAKHDGQYYLNDVNRFLYASHLHAEGKVFPVWLADETVS